MRMMRRLGWIMSLLLCMNNAEAAPQWAFRISFSDKTGSPALSNPSAFLSARSQARRSLLHIAVTDADRPVSPVYLDSVLTLTSGKVHTRSRWFNNAVILLTDSSKIRQLTGRTFITSIDYVGYFAAGLHKGSPVSIQPATTSTLPAPAHKGTGTAAYYGSTWDQTTMVNGDYLHDNNLTGQGQLIAVLDLGFAGTDTHRGFDSMRAHGRLADEYNFVTASSSIYSAYAGWDHGTQSLSTMAGFIPNTYVGSAPEASYALYVTDDNLYSDALYELDNMVAGMERADSLGADIITASVAYNTFTNPYNFSFTKADLNGHTTIVAKAVNKAVAAGIFVVITAGNEGGNGWNFLLTPGDADSAITIGAVNPDRSSASFSGPGPNSSGMIKPDVCALGNPASVLGNGNSVLNNSGTSFSTPQIAGWAACIRQSRPSVTPYELRTAINRSAHLYATPTAQMGYGIPDFKKVLQSVGIYDTNNKRNSLSVSPNPFKEQINIQVTLNKALEINCVLTDIEGRVVMEKKISTAAGKQQFSLPMPASLPAGTYMLRTTAGGDVFSNKLIKL